MSRPLPEVLATLGAPKVLVVGDIVLDRYLTGAVERISPEAPIQVLRVENEEERLGCAGSVAQMLSVLGAETTLVGVVGDDKAAGLYNDESSFLKKGKASVGVQRQWSGRAGKIENCQVGVFACLGRGERMCITDFRLYLPESWAEDRARCDKAKIPEEHNRYQPKWKQALDMVAHARQQGKALGCRQ